MEVGAAFGDVARNVNDRMLRAHGREESGQASTREEVFTEQVQDDFDELVKERLAALSDRYAETGSNVSIKFEATKAPQGEESGFGLDLGIRVIIETTGYSTQKAILVQCKRMFGVGGSGTFPKLRDDGAEQARKMLEVTPASFFFLFNAGDPCKLLEMMRSATLLPWDEPFEWFHLLLPYFDPGIAVLPAARVLAMSEAATAAKTKLPIKAEDVLAGSIPLGHFIAGVFAPCFVGDPRMPIIQLATPPADRADVSGLDATVPELGHLKTRRFHKLKIVKNKKS